MTLIQGFVGGGYKSPTLAANNQRCVNFLLEVDQKGGKTPAALVGVPGLRTRAESEAGASKAYLEVNGITYAAIGQTFGTLDATGTFSNIASYVGTGRIKLISNGLQVLVMDGVSGFVYDIDAVTWTQITDPGFVYGATQGTFQDGYGIIALPNSQQFGISGLYDFMTWDAIDFASAEGLPDNVATVISNNRYLHVLGTDTLELWVNTGGSATNLFPFERIGGTFFQVGCSAPNSAVISDDSVFWLGSNAQGGNGVYRMQGQAPTRISTLAVEREWSSYARIDDAFGLGIDIGRHPIYMLTFPTADKTWIFDAHSQEWSEWLEWDGTEWHRSRINCFAKSYRYLIAGDYRNGKVYEITFDEFTNGGDVLRSMRQSPYIWNEGKRMFHSRLELFCEPGVGLTEGYGSDPEVSMRFSDDGRRWSNETTAKIGAQGAFDARAVFNRLGSARNRIYEVVMDAPVKHAIIGASLAVA